MLYDPFRLTRPTKIRTVRGRHSHHPHGSPSNHSRWIDVARFGLLSIATLPFSLWVALYSYAYYCRVPICREALTQEDDEIRHLIQSSSSAKNKVVNNKETKNNNKSQQLVLGHARQRQLAQVKALLSHPPHQMIVVAGTNESGKSRFVAEIVAGLSSPLRNQGRGVCYIQLAQIVDSLSTLTHALVRSFDLKWLQMRHSLVDVLPFAGSEILVMKERFSDRDLAQALLVITEALILEQQRQEQHHDNSTKSTKKKSVERPVIVVDGLGEGSRWIRSPEGKLCLERLLKWCVYITKERKLAHVVLTGNEELVISLMDENRITRGHVKVIGLADLTKEEAADIVWKQWPDASLKEVAKITNIFGGFIHDVQAVSREIQSRLLYGKDYDIHGGSNDDDGGNTDNNNNHESSPIVSHALMNRSATREKVVDDVISARFRLQVERVTAAFAKGASVDSQQNNNSNNHRKDNADDNDMDPYLDPLKALYSEAQASQLDADADAQSGGESASWSQLQLWETLQRLVASENMAVPFGDLRDDVFEGNTTPLIELMNEDVLGFEVENSTSSSSQGSWSWVVKPATPALGRVFHHLINNSHLKERFADLQQMQERREKLDEIELENRQLQQERQRLDMRKASLLKTVELGKELRVRWDRATRKDVENVFSSMVAQEVANEKRRVELRQELQTIATANALRAAKKEAEESAQQNADSERLPATDQSSIKQQLKSAILKTFAEDNDKDKFARFRQAFEQMSSDGAGITAGDVARLIKETSGEDVDSLAVEAFIRRWDDNKNAALEYEEFMRMLLADPRSTKTNKTIEAENNK